MTKAKTDKTKKAKGPVTLKRVAEVAGVNIATASRVLSGKGDEYRISASTQNSVQEVAAKLAYRPNHAAQSLRTKRSGLLGVLVPDIANPFFAAIAKQVTSAAEESGYSVLLADSQDEIGVEQKLVTQLRARQVEGFVVCPVGTSSEHLLALTQASAEMQPLVLVDRVFEEQGMVTVTSDHSLAARKVMEMLIQAGHRRIGVLQGLPGTLPNTERLTAYRTALKEHGIPYEAGLVRGHHFNEASGYESACSLMREHPDITAFFAMSNMNALGALRAAPEFGREVPRDLSIVTFDDHPFADFLSAPLTAAVQDIPEIGRVAADMLLTQIKSNKMPDNGRIRIPVKIISRASVSSPPDSTR